MLKRFWSSCPVRLFAKMRTTGWCYVFLDAGGWDVLPGPWEAAKSYVKEQWWSWLWFPSSDSQPKQMRWMKLFKEGSISKAAIEIAFLPKIHERLQFLFFLHHSQKIRVHGCFLGPCFWCDFSHAFFHAASHRRKVCSSYGRRTTWGIPPAAVSAVRSQERNVGNGRG